MSLRKLISTSFGESHDGWRMGFRNEAAVTHRIAAAHEDQWAIDYIAWHRNRCADDVARISSMRPGARILNVGGAPYLFEALAQAAGLNVTSVDLAPERHFRVVEELGIKAIKLDFENPIERKSLDLTSYDVICLCEVLEHMRRDLVELLSDLADRMSEETILYLTTPNFYYPPRILTMLREWRSGPSLVAEWRKISDLGHMGHIREYSRRELSELFEFTGLRILKSEGRNSQPMRWYWRPFCSVFRVFAQEFVFTLVK